MIEICMSIAALSMAALCISSAFYLGTECYWHYWAKDENEKT
jgi:hypothetical protein